jgi:WD40 repeat protein
LFVGKSAIIDKRSEVEGGIWSLSPEPPLSHAERGALMKLYSFGSRVDWGEALDVSLFYGRTSELALLAKWIVQERCRIVRVLGMGGIGKSALAITFMRQVTSSFHAMVFRSVRDAPPCMDLLCDCLQVLSPQPLPTLPTSIERSIDLLLECFQTQRCLLVLDNLETLLQERDSEGRIRAGYEDYITLLRRVAETPHQSCLLVTSRESLAELRQQESRQTDVRALRLGGLESDACEQLFEECDLVGTTQDRMRLVQRYVGNPLALKIVAESITELFGGEIGPFLEQDTVIFSSIRDLLARQWTRLTALEQALLIWLAIVREPREETDLHAMLEPPVAVGQVHEALEALYRCSLVERGQQQATFTLQSVVLEYVTEGLVERVSEQIQHALWEYLISYALEQAGAKEYVRQAQERLIVAQILLRLQALSRETDVREDLLLSLLNQLRGWDQEAQGYGPANLIMLLRRLRGHLCGLDLSHLAIRGGYLQGVEMQDTKLCGSMLSDTVFTEALHAIWAVAVSSTGKFWAAGSWRGEVRIWSEGGQRLHLVWQAHTDNVFTLAFSPDERTLATGSWDSTVKLWDVQSGTLLWVGRHTNLVQSVAFAPDGHTLASGGNDTVVQLWDLPSGKPVQTLTSQGNVIYSLVWSPDGHMLACGGFDGCIRLWLLQRGQPAACVKTLVGHSNWVHSLAFAPDGTQLASGSWDNTVKLWDVASGRVLQTLTGHTQRIYSVAWSPDGRTLASASFDKTIWLWDVAQKRYRAALHGHTAAVYSLAFTTDSSRLLSSSEDSTIRVWDVDSGECVRILQGYAVCFYGLDWSPAGSHLVSGSTDGLVIIWEGTGKMSPRVLGAHHWLVHDVAWSPDRRWIASCGWDNAIRLWEPTTGACLYILRNPEQKDILFLGAAWSPDGRWFASGSYLEGIHIWDVTERRLHMVEQTSQIVFRDIAWSPDGTQLASGSNDGSVCLWDPFAGTLQQRLPGHQGIVMKVAWSPDGTRLASAGDGRSGGELLVWEVQSGKCVRSFVGQPALVFAVTWDLSGDLLVSGDSDGTLRWWDVPRGECVRVRQGHQGIIRALRRSPNGQWVASCGDDGAIRIWDLHSGEYLHTLRRDRPYERLDITGIKGLTEAQKATLRALGAVEDASVN